MDKAKLGLKLTTGEFTYKYDYETKDLFILKTLEAEEVARIMDDIMIKEKLVVGCIKIREVINYNEN